MKRTKMWNIITSKAVLNHNYEWNLHGIKIGIIKNVWGCKMILKSLNIFVLFVVKIIFPVQTGMKYKIVYPN